MKVDRKTLLLYAVTDRSWLGQNSLAAQVEEAIRAGVTIVQLREKELPTEDFLSEAMAVKKVTRRYGVPLIINDNIEVTLACDADGVHIGQKDMALPQARKLLGAQKIIGVSASTIEEALLAEEQGADYLGVGSVFSTSTKPEADKVSIDTLKEICQKVSIPVVAIGGINANNLLLLKNSGIAGVAVVSAIFAQPDIGSATRQLRQLVQEAVQL